MRYQLLLFDLDDTLLDFGANEADALPKLFERHGVACSDELLAAYHCVNKRLWNEYEAGVIALDEVLSTRFCETMLRLGDVVDGREWENEYRELLGNGCQLMEGALDVCKRLSKSHRLFVITNGATQTQLKRLRQSGLDAYFEAVFTSQGIGFQKPSKEFFDYVRAHISGFHDKDALVIGDSLHTDILGGLRAGMDTCWMNPKAQQCPAGIQSTYTIRRLADLYDIC